ncbi:TPA: hypothetical protein I7730_16140 [Vibrio vulnificus]|uniref:Uncharacterized protein n=1 Tax=Vibrio vulnificus TaxID=672 RepID=A0A8H9TG95_VIBVL|nr:hypothetical protein [Vibrio vulnificus]
MFNIDKNLYYFISQGENSVMYTLRIHTQGHRYIGGEKVVENRSYHIKNLSEDLTKAKAKAVEYIESEGEDLALKVNEENLRNKRQANRRTPEQIAADKAEAAQKQKEREEKRQQEADERVSEAMEGFGLNSPLSFGKYKDNENYPLERLIRTERDYLEFILKNNQPENGASLPFPNPQNGFQAQVNWIYENVTFGEEKESNFVGVKGEQIQFTGTVTKIDSDYKQVNDYHSVCMTQYTLVDDEGNKVIVSYSGSKWEMEDDTRYTFTATVKSHYEKHNKKTTYLAKAKNIVKA